LRRARISAPLPGLSVAKGGVVLPCLDMLTRKRFLAYGAGLLMLACSQGASDAGGSAGAGGGAGAAAGTAGTAGASSGSSGALPSDASSGGALAGGPGSGGAASGSAGAQAAGGAASAGASGANAGSAGIPFKGVANSPCASRTLLNVSWYYNWTQKESEPCTDGKGGAFVPMIWGHSGAEQTAASIQSAVSGFVGKGYAYVLGFNEPDNTSQSNISAATAISLLASFDNPGIEVGTPATQANTTGQAWFRDYLSQVAATPTLRDDFIAIHWYGWNAGSCDANASQLESYVKYAEGFPGNRPIWLTEWACLNLSAPTPEGVLAFYKGALAVFARHPRVQRYAWYPWTTNCELNDKTGSLTPLGVAYAAAPATK
jgi:hypothetical protein